MAEKAATEDQVESSKGREPTAEEVQNAIRENFRRGRPEKAFKIRALVAAGEPVTYDLLDFSGLKSEKVVEGVLEVPPRAGKGSGVENWKEFAKTTSDLDEEVIESMNRDEIIDMLEAKQIIPPLEQDEE